VKKKTGQHLEAHTQLRLSGSINRPIGVNFGPSTLEHVGVINGLYKQRPTHENKCI